MQKTGRPQKDASTEGYAYTFSILPETAEEIKTGFTASFGFFFSGLGFGGLIARQQLHSPTSPASGKSDRPKWFPRQPGDRATQQPGSLPAKQPDSQTVRQSDYITALRINGAASQRRSVTASQRPAFSGFHTDSSVRMPAFVQLTRVSFLYILYISLTNIRFSLGRTAHRFTL